MEQEPKPLDYATRVGEYPEPHHHAGPVVLLIGLNALAGMWLIILGLFYSLDLPLYGVLLLASGAALCWATLGKLPYPEPKFGAALLLSTVGLACAIAVAVLAQSDLTARLGLYGKHLAPPPNIRARATFEEREVFTFEMIRNAVAVSAGLSTALCIYAASRLALRRRGR